MIGKLMSRVGRGLFSPDNYNTYSTKGGDLNDLVGFIKTLTVISKHEHSNRTVYSSARKIRQKVDSLKAAPYYFIDGFEPARRPRNKSTTEGGKSGSYEEGPHANAKEDRRNQEMHVLHERHHI